MLLQHNLIQADQAMEILEVILKFLILVLDMLVLVVVLVDKLEIMVVLLAVVEQIQILGVLQL